MAFPIPENEAIRLTSIAELQIMDTEPDADFDNLVAIVKDLLDVPMAAISIIGAERLWFKSILGADLIETPRDIAFCSHAICSNETFVVNNATHDPRFSENPLVVGEPMIRAYAGQTLATTSGVAVGTLCVLDVKSRNFCPADLSILRRLARTAEAMLEKHRTSLNLLAKTNELSEQIRSFDRACDLAKIGSWERSEGSDQVRWSSSMYALHETQMGDVISLASLLTFYISSDRLRLQSIMENARETKSRFEFEGRMYTAKGNLIWVRVTGEFDVIDGKIIRSFGLKQDITEEKITSSQISRLADCDDLTGLLNRRGLRRSMSDLLMRNYDRSEGVFFIAFDLDDFKEINDFYGHGAGDICLRRIARRVRVVLKRRGILARTGGDEFAVYCERSMSSNDVGELCDTILASVFKPIKWGLHTFKLSASIGYTVRPAHAFFDQDDLIREADLALYSSKIAGKNCVRGYSPSLGSHVEKKSNELRQAKSGLSEGRFQLYYQPKVRLLDRAIIGFEALLRLRSRDGTILSPNAFWAGLEDAALSREIADFVMSQALDQAKAWQTDDVPFGGVAINLAASQFKDPEFALQFETAIADRGLRSELVTAELTEGILLSGTGNNILHACEKLSKAGVRISLDDFGTGFASLTHLRDFPVDEIKIDRSFVGDLSNGGGGAAIVNSMVSLANNMSLSVVAEGVETYDQAVFLQAVGCRIAQGYLFSQPLPADAATQLAKDNATGGRVLSQTKNSC